MCLNQYAKDLKFSLRKTPITIEQVNHILNLRHCQGLYYQTFKFFNLLELFTDENVFLVSGCLDEPSGRKYIHLSESEWQQNQYKIFTGKLDIMAERRES